MSEVPPVFRKSITSHNRQCWIAAVISLGTALLGWLVFGVLFTGAVLLQEIIRTGNPDLRGAPGWLWPLMGTLAAALVTWAGIERWARRYRPLDDRPIIGWHLFVDVLLTPARMTYAIWDHLSLRVSLSAIRRREAWRLLQFIEERKRVPVSTLGQAFPDGHLLSRLLLALQLTGWIDLHRGDEDWNYVLRSEAEQRLRLLAGAAEETED